MKPCGLLLDPVFREHLTAAGHPERAARLLAIEKGLRDSGLLARLTRVPPRAATDDELLRIHHRTYLDRLRAACAAGNETIDCADSSICPESERVARLVVGGVIDAALSVARGELRSAFCAVRPPGHHAEPDASMGFCLYNSVALATRAVQCDAGIERVLILDWDVHHGNGTQHAFERDASVLFISLHGHPNYLYPHTGFERERGIGPGDGFTININLPPGAADGDYRDAFDRRIAPAVERFAPQMLLVSAGFDAHADDPLGITHVSDEGFRWMTRRVIEWADAHCDGRLISILEGGYNLGVLERCVAEHVRALSEPRP